jgi:hypothetical protein
VVNCHSMTARICIYPDHLLILQALIFTLTSVNSDVRDGFLAKLDTDGNFIWAEHICRRLQGFFNIGMESADDGVFYVRYVGIRCLLPDFIQ